MPPKRKKTTSGRHKPGSRTRVNGYIGKSNWDTAKKAEVWAVHRFHP